MRLRIVLVVSGLIVALATPLSASATTKLSVSAKASPTSIAAKGGIVALRVLVSGAMENTECMFSSTPAIRGFAGVVKCKDGATTRAAYLGKNTGKVRTVRLKVTVANSRASVATQSSLRQAESTTATPISTTTPTSTAPTKTIAVAPVITAQPQNESNSVGDYVVFTASASGNPAPTESWQVSTDGGVTWSALPKTDESTSAPAGLEVVVDDEGNLTGDFAQGVAGSSSGDEYRAAFTNSAGSVTSNSAILTATWTSTTFTGYLDFAPIGESFTAASANWVVPTVTCSTDYAGQWAVQWPGVGDLTSVVQDGTGEGCDGYTPDLDSAWYEIVGDPAVSGGGQVILPTTQYPVEGGDNFSASVSLVNSIWTMTMTDSTQNWTFTISEPNNVTPPLNQQTAMLVTESSAENVVDYGATNFTNALVTLNGQSGSLGSFDPLQLELYQGSTPLETAGPFDSTGKNFTDTWNNF
jgi:hypothetical protein